MRLHTRPEIWRTALCAALGVSCGGTAKTSEHTTTGSGGVLGSGGAITGGGGGSPVSLECRNPVPLDERAPGYVQCEDGPLVLLASDTCWSSLPRPEPVGDYNPELDACQFDADCAERPHGHCTRVDNGGAIAGRYCHYGCVSNEDCADDQVCICGEPVGACVHAECMGSDDCGPGLHCSAYDRSPGCGSISFACQTPADSCTFDGQCEGAACSRGDDGRRSCQSGACAIGRPFLIDGAARTAGLAVSADWCPRDVTPDLAGIAPELRQHLADEWTHAARMEHASIAAFARFTLELLAFGAPPELVADTTRAIDDERRHAELCFALASAYRGSSTGPGALDLDGALGQPEFAASVLGTFREGCLGETLAALEAAELAERTRDPAVARVHATIAADEQRHAELAWRFVRWALDRAAAQGDTSVHAALAAEIEALERQAAEWKPLPCTAGDLRLAEHGVLPAALRSSLHADALRRLVLPVARALLDAGSNRHAA